MLAMPGGRSAGPRETSVQSEGTSTMSAPVASVSGTKSMPSTADRRPWWWSSSGVGGRGGLVVRRGGVVVVFLGGGRRVVAGAPRRRRRRGAGSRRRRAATTTATDGDQRALALLAAAAGGLRADRRAADRRRAGRPDRRGGAAGRRRAGGAAPGRSTTGCTPGPGRGARGAPGAPGGGGGRPRRPRRSAAPQEPQKVAPGSERGTALAAERRTSGRSWPERSGGGRGLVAHGSQRSGGPTGSRDVAQPARRRRSPPTPRRGGGPRCGPGRWRPARTSRPSSRVWVTSAPVAFTASRTRWVAASPSRWAKQTRASCAGTTRSSAGWAVDPRRRGRRRARRPRARARPARRRRRCGARTTASARGSGGRGRRPSPGSRPPRRLRDAALRRYSGTTDMAAVELGPVGDVEHVAVHAGEQPLVRVEAVAVGGVEAGGDERAQRGLEPRPTRPWRRRRGATRRARAGDGADCRRPGRRP